ncbi:MAG TPA: gliding motility-associated ABC transporter permease subunit GldF [Ginsengibacter sp.]|nr:gliding motility-associated ABC transporter permease subunit GldF [Chitinophagaceae bacterium]HRN73000.1 gliding motility-associated ABC transporter permease subunit GldF [Ginsengibacter sp.]HRP16509.1 gliding motility-associated ABC transporter permease subunit GldF [Ginsengibacter sp.]HRP43679.1 gliding motility-associated ABC transporter permease subunit GldF [Ginsengibacter sp.]
MVAIARKELQQFFSSFGGYIALLLFLLLNALYLFVLRDSNVFDLGYATLEPFFSLAPWVFIFLIPSIAMRSFSEEFKGGTFELLKTFPLSDWQVVLGKYIAVVLVVVLALLPTVAYPYIISALTADTGIDTGAIIGSYIGLVLLGAVFAAISVWCSTLSSNSVVAFLLGAFMCLLLYYGFSALSKIPVFTGNADYYIEMMGIDLHYQNISRGVVDTRDIVYFLSLIVLFLFASRQNIRSHE